MATSPRLEISVTSPSGGPAVLSHDLETICLKALEKDPDHRYPTAGRMAEDLRRFTDRFAIHARRAGYLSRCRKLIQRHRVAVAVAAVLVVVASIGSLLIGSLLWRGESTPALPRIHRTVQLTHTPGLELDPAISRDGQRVTFAAGPVGQMKIYVREITGAEPRCLTEELPGEHRWPRWSPDSTRIAFGVSEKAIYVVPAGGGKPEPLVEPPSKDYAIHKASFVWDPEGQKLAYAVRRTQQWSYINCTVYVRPVDGGESKKLVEARDVFPLCWSPDGALIAYSRGNSGFVMGSPGEELANIGPASLWVVAATGGEPIRVTENAFLDQSPVWTPNGKSLVFISSRGGSRDIYQIPIGPGGAPSGPPVRLTTGLDPHTVSLSAHGERLAYSRFSMTQNIWTMPISPNSEPTSLTQARPVTAGNQAIEGVDVSRDGRWLAFDSNRTGNQDIYVMPIEGGELRQLTSHPADDFVPVWSPDGTEIVFYSLRGGNRDVFVVSADGESLRQLTSDPAQDFYPEWSPDRKRLIFCSDRDDRRALYELPSDRGEPEGERPRRLMLGVDRARWSPDGRWIAFSGSRDGFRGLYVMSAEGGEPRLLIEWKGRIDPAWTPDDSQTVYYKSLGLEGETRFGSVPVSSGKPKLLVRFNDSLRKSVRGEFATDGKSFYFTLSEYDSDLWLAEVAASSWR